MWGAVLPNARSPRLDVCDDIELTGPPGPGEVRLRVHATGLCHSDLSAMDGSMPIRLPAVLGHEAAGTIVEVGEGVSTTQVGDHVVVAAVPPCGRCHFCVRGEAYLCVNFASMFTPKSRHQRRGEKLNAFCGIGSFAAHTVLPQDAVVPIDPEVPFDVACIVGCAVVTGVGAVFNAAKMRPGATVVVLGCGGVGMSVVLGARAAGASTIVAVDPSEAKQRTALRLGATHAVPPDQLTVTGKAIHRGTGFDHAFEAVGRSQTVRAAYDAVRRGGSVVVLGIGDRKDPVQFSAYELAWSAKTVMGSTYGSGDVRHEFPRLLSLWRSGVLPLTELISARLPIGEINEGLDAMRRGEGIRHVVQFTEGDCV
ncbi:MAG TPA: alcohol dehydrogenase catalytic domain-containing protein [Pseudonocardia sp.]